MKPSSSDKKIMFALLGLTLIGAGVGTQLQHIDRTVLQEKGVASVVDAVASTTPETPDITLGFVGDIMLDRGVAYNVKKNFKGDYTSLFAEADFLKKPDIMFANLEGPISDKGENVGSIYSFRMDPKSIPALKDSGIDIVSFANNHVGDWTRSAFEDTITRLHSAGILTCGAGFNKKDASTPAIIDENGFRVGFLCFSDVGPGFMSATDTDSGIIQASDPDFDAIVKNASKEVNALIVSFHWGEEYKQEHNERQEELAKRAIDNGAVMVVGHHPHVAQDATLYNDRPIIYSLGNFIFDQSFSKVTMTGLFVTATLRGDEVLDVIQHTVAISKQSVPSLTK